MSQQIASPAPEFFESTIKWFNFDKGFGFVRHIDGKDLFLHRNETRGDLNNFVDNAQVRYSVGPGRNGLQATNASIIGEIHKEKSNHRPDGVQNDNHQPKMTQVGSQDQDIADLRYITEDRRTNPGRKLTQWAKIAIDDFTTKRTITNESGELIETDRHVSSNIPALAKEALFEEWCFKDEADKYSILKSYVRHTFYRLAKHKQIAFSNQYACINTGLVDNLYEPIYGLFRRRRNCDLRKGQKPFDFVSWCVEGKDDAGKQLIREFPVRPQAARYFTDIQDVIFEDKHGLTTQWDHVLEDAIVRNRYPLHFLFEHTPDQFKWDSRPLPEQLQEFANTLRSDTQCRRRMKNRMEDAIKLARKRASWNYKTAIPLYYPTRDNMCLLLPLALLDDKTVDLALVVQRANIQEYYGVTVYPLNMAYKGARLVLRPDSDWLRPDIKTEAGSTEDE